MRGETLVSKERVGALNDGVVAIAATILVLDLKLPDNGVGLSPESLAQNMNLFLGWIISIAMIATVWYEQHYLFRRATSWNDGLIVLTFLQLAAVSLIPFGSGLVAEYPGSLTAAIVFSGVMLANGALIAGHSLLLSFRPHLWEVQDAGDSLRRRAAMQLACYVAITGLAVAGATLHHPILGVIAWSLSPVLVATTGRLRSLSVPLHIRGHRVAAAESAREA